MWVWQGENEITADHIRVFLAMKWAVKTDYFKVSGQVLPMTPAKFYALTL